MTEGDGEKSVKKKKKKKEKKREDLMNVKKDQKKV